VNAAKDDAKQGARKKDEAAPPPVISAPPEHDLERRLKRNPDDLNVHADVGSDESMDASDPSSAVHPGELDKPAPSSGFPERPEKK
jgi:hypothetical protein